MQCRVGQRTDHRTGARMSEYLKPQAFLDNAYTHVLDWKRKFPWTISSKANCFETVYTRETYGPQAVRVYVHKDYIRDCTAAVFDIDNQLRRANRVKRGRDSRRRR